MDPAIAVVRINPLLISTAAFQDGERRFAPVTPVVAMGSCRYRSRRALHFTPRKLAMLLRKTSIRAFGWKAHDFALKGVDGKTYTLADVRAPKGTLVVFICNHCPYVRSVIGRLAIEAKALGEIGIGTIAIMPNDTKAYREDSFDNMKLFAAKHCFTFPSVIDATQEVARAYGAQCTPDFFGFKPARRVAVSRRPRCSAKSG